MGNKPGHHHHAAEAEATAKAAVASKPAQAVGGTAAKSTQGDDQFKLRPSRLHAKRHSVTGIESDIKMKYDLDTKELGHGA